MIEYGYTNSMFYNGIIRNLKDSEKDIILDLLGLTQIEIPSNVIAGVISVKKGEEFFLCYGCIGLLISGAMYSCTSNKDGKADTVHCLVNNYMYGTLSPVCPGNEYIYTMLEGNKYTEPEGYRMIASLDSQVLLINLKNGLNNKEVVDIIKNYFYHFSKSNDKILAIHNVSSNEEKINKIKETFPSLSTLYHGTIISNFFNISYRTWERYNKI